MSGFGPLNDGWRNDAAWQPPVSLDAFLPLENTPLDDGGDAWWAGVQHSFVGVPRAAGLTALGLSAALCAGLQQQTDEVVPRASAETASYAAASQRLRYQTQFVRWHQVDELPVVAVPLAADEDSYTIAMPSLSTVVGVLWATDEGVLPATAGPDEEGWVPVVLPGARAPWQLPMLADELPGTVTVAALDDGGWTAPLPSQQVMAAQLLSVPDELVGVQPPDDSYWWRGEWLASAITTLPLNGEDELPSVVVQLALDESGWWSEVTPAGIAQLVPTAPPDEVPIAASALLVDDALWLAEAPALVPPVRWVVYTTDELVTPLPALEDGAWSAPALIPTAPLRLVLVDTDELPVTTPLALEDERWVPGFALAVLPSRLTLVDADVAVTQPAPLVEETYWLALTSPPSRFYRYDLLAQDDLVPSTALLESLARTYVVNAEHRGYVVNAEHRQAVQSAEHRTLIVDPQKRST